MTEQYDPFGNDVAQAQLITQMKIYDVLMALLMSASPEVAKDLDTLHTQGIVLGHGPTFSQFMDRAELGETDDSSVPPLREPVYDDEEYPKSTN